MGQIEREVKILNIDVNKIKNILKKNGVEPKGKYIQDVYAYDLPTVDTFYKKYVSELIDKNDKRGLLKLIREVRPCFDKKDLIVFEKVIGISDILSYINDEKSDYTLLADDRIVDVMKKAEENFSKWVRLRQTGDITTITIKRIVNSKGEYALDAVDELEFEVPSIDDGKQFLEDLGFFFARHQIKMRIAYDYKNTEIVIDKWPLLNPYIEIEGPTEDDIKDTIEMLGFSQEDSIVINTDDVYASIGIDIYSDEFKDLSFTDEEKEQIDSFLE